MPKMISVDLTSFCAHCRYEHNRASPLDGVAQRPKNGDITICIRCGEWNVFEDNLQLRKPTVDEYMEIGKRDDCNEVREAWIFAVYGNKKGGLTH